MERESREDKKQEPTPVPESRGKEQAGEENGEQRKDERVTPRTLAEQAVKRRRAERGA